MTPIVGLWGGGLGRRRQVSPGRGRPTVEPRLLPYVARPTLGVLGTQPSVPEFGGARKTERRP